MEPIVKAENLSKHYRRAAALDGLTFDIHKGAIYGLIGRNGAGKTTLIRILCGLQNPDQGTFCLYGKENKDPAILNARQRMGALVDTPAIDPALSARDHLRWQYRLLGLAEDEQIDEILALTGLDKAGRKKARHFSYGMKQRLGLAMALCGGPDLLILDEPTQGLDPQGIIELRELILKLNRQKQITFLISSHYLDELARIASHYGFLEQGKLIEQISKEELEEKLQKSLRIQVDKPQALLPWLDENKIAYQIVDDQSLDLFGNPVLPDVIQAIQSAGIHLQGLQERQESLEGYFIQLLEDYHD